MQNKSAKDRVQQIREQFDLSRKELGEEIGMSLSNISRIESGKIEPSDAFLNALTIRFAINSDWVKTGQGEMFITSEEYIAKGIKLLGAEKFGEGLNNILKDPRFPELRSAVIFSEVVKDSLDQDLAAYLQYIIKLSQHKDERKRNWLMVQLERAFPEVGERGEKYKK